MSGLGGPPWTLDLGPWPTAEPLGEPLTLVRYCMACETPGPAEVQLHGPFCRHVYWGPVHDMY